MKKLLFSTFLAFSIITVQAKEVIKSYHSDITIHKDGTLKVKETIVVHAEGKNIRQGIYRDFPTHYKPGLMRTIVPFNATSITRNGKHLPLEQTPIVFRGQRVYMRDGTWLQYGEHRFELEYTTARQIGFFNKHDELYWNVVGGDWMFPILHSSATIHLPDNVTTDQLKYTAYAGRQGSQNKAFKVEIKNEHTIKFFCSEKLKPRQAFSIILGMPKGSITPPTSSQKWTWRFQDNKDRLFLLAMLLLFCVYVVCMYFVIQAKDPKNPIIPLFEPPKDFTPGMVNYFVKRKFTTEGFAADIVNMGVYGWIQIFESKKWRLFGKEYVLEAKARQNKPVEYLEPFSEFFAKGKTMTLDKASQDQTFKAFESLKDRYDKTVKCYLVDGYVLSSFMFFGLSVFGLMFFMNYHGIYGAVDAPIALFMGLGLLVAFWLYRLTRSYTPEGFEVRDHIEGFKRYLEIAEVPRFKYISTPPVRTPELYEKYLPYAMALGVEEEWTQSFTPIFANLEQAGTPYHPVWYHGHVGGFRSSGLSSSTFASGLGSSLASSINASAPGTNSGFGGGSGGGAGGGGGGGGGGGC